MSMTAASTTGFSIVAPSLASTPQAIPSTKAEPTTGRRHISYKTARTLEILAHAIEYLTDEKSCEASGDPSSHEAHLKAVQLLMGCNHEVYFACPQLPTLRERLHSFLHPHMD